MKIEPVKRSPVKRMSLRSELVLGDKVKPPEIGLPIINENQLLSTSPKQVDSAVIRFETKADMQLSIEYDELRRRALALHCNTLREVCEIYKSHLEEEQKTLNMAKICVAKLSNCEEIKPRIQLMSNRFIDALICILAIIFIIAYPEPMVWGEICANSLTGRLVFIFIPLFSALFYLFTF